MRINAKLHFSISADVFCIFCQALHASRSCSGLARHPASYTQQYFAQEKAIRAPGDEAGPKLLPISDSVFVVIQGVLRYVHTVTFSHRFLLFGSKLEFPWDCGTIQSHAKTLPCARSLSAAL